MKMNSPERATDLKTPEHMKEVIAAANREILLQIEGKNPKSTPETIQGALDPEGETPSYFDLLEMSESEQNG